MAHGAEKGLHPVRQSPVPVQPRPAERLLPDGLARLEGISAEQKEAMLIRTRHKVIHHLEKLFYLMDETDTIDSMRKNIITPTEV